MKKTKLTRSLLAACSIVALSAVMYGCTHSGDTKTVIEEVEVEVTDPTTALFARAQDARDMADGANEMAGDAVETAMEAADGLTTMDVAGDSGMALANAQAILKAMADAGQAVTDAETALADAKAAKTEAEAVDDTNEHKASLIAALDAAIMAAEDAIEMAEASRDNADLESAVTDVTGGENADPQGTPRSIANMVGMDIAMALLPESASDGGGTRHTHGATAPGDEIADELKVEMTNGVGKTWAMLVGEDNLQRMPIGTANAGVMVASFAGMARSSITDTLAEDATEGTDGAAYAANYQGIPGMAHCFGADCKVEDGKLTGSWYFAPTSSTTAYIRNPDAVAARTTRYIAETLFASFGHWLVLDGTEWAVNTFAVAGSEAGTDFTVLASDDLDDSATYSGTAAGMSVLKADNAAGDGQDIDSGRFAANVTLMAEFGANSTLSGMIDGFSGSAVNENWTVSLDEQAFEAGTLTGGATTTTGRDGEWSATSYGTVATARPAGIFGGFNAHFSDGHAAGAYATRRD